MNKETIGKSIKMHRVWKNLSQKDLAKKSKVSQSTIAHIEIGRKFPSIDVLIKIAQVFKVKPGVLLVEVEL